MYRCQHCQQVVPPNTKAHRVVVETRVRVYPFRKEVNRVVRDRHVEYTHDQGGLGREIVREIIICPACAAKLQRTP
jgi:hypothetical protein